MDELEWVLEQRRNEHRERLSEIEQRRHLRDWNRRLRRRPSAGEGGIGIGVATLGAWGIQVWGPALDPVLLSFLAATLASGVSWLLNAIRRAVGATQSEVLKAFLDVSLLASDGDDD